MDPAHSQPSKYWVNKVTDDILAQHPEGRLVVESGHSPSGSYTFGHFREIITASVLAQALRERGRDAVHQDFVDDFDALRKIPAGVPEEWKQYIGMPLYMAPDPFDCHPSYGQHYLSSLYAATDALGLEIERVYAHDQYPAGKFTEAIELSLENIPQVRRIITEVSKRELPDTWVPVQILSDSNNLREWDYTGWDKARGVVQYKDKDGKEGEVSYREGRVKLDWRLDWPARWHIWNITVEPFGRDHASRGGSYDTGSALQREIFGGEPPYPVPYDFVNPVGQTKKMSKSVGGVVTALEALDIMPPEIVRFFMVRSMPSRQLIFDEGLGLFNIIEEYARTEAAVQQGQDTPFADAYRLAEAGTTEKTISSVAFSHLVSVYQTAHGDTERVLEVLKRTGYAEAVEQERAVIERELGFVANWLATYAPESVKFAVQDALPEVELSDAQRQFLVAVAASIEAAKGDVDGQKMHELIYDAKDASDLPTGEAFKALYRVILGKDAGPKAGWFLASLDHDWLVQRLRLTA
jgi:lysyl-tRNA synthetase class 1